MIVSIVKDWDDPDIFRQTPGQTGIWDDIQFVHGNSFFADVLVVLNAPPKNLLGYYRNGGKWVMSQEPPHEFYRWQTQCYKSFDKVFTFWDPEEFPGINIINTHTCLPWHVGKTYDELTQLKVKDLPHKKDEVSWVTSSLNTRPGHALRLSFIDYLQRHRFPFALYGRGFDPIADKFNGIAPYKYSIAIENFACNDYWTEKITDCFLSWTMPVYYGCKNIAEYFPGESMIQIDPAQPREALAEIESAIKENRWEKNLEAIAEARNLILNQYQFFPAIASRIKHAGIQGNKRKISYIRKPIFK